MNYVDPDGLWRRVDLGYEAQEGDTLWGLAVQLFQGQGRKWRDLGYPYDLGSRPLQVGDVIGYQGGLIEYENGVPVAHVSTVVFENNAYHEPEPMPEPPKRPEPAPSKPTASGGVPNNSGSVSSTNKPGNVNASGMSSGGMIPGGGKTPGTGTDKNEKPPEVYGPPVPPNLYGPPDSLKKHTYGIKNYDKKYKTASTLILNLAPEIIRAAKDKNVDAQVLAGVIFAENMLNVSFIDTYLEYPAYMSIPIMDFSLGVAQVRISTAEYIEEKGYMPVVKGKWSFIVYYSADEMRATLLQNDYYCILYAAAYLRLLADMWMEDFPTIEYRPDIWASLYNLGHNRIPHANPQPRYPFGVLVGDYYDHMGELLYYL